MARPTVMSRVMYRTAAVALVACAAAWSLACAQDTHAAPGAGRYAHDVDDAVPKIERAVGLKFKRPPKVEPRSKAEVRAFLEKEFNTSHAERDLEGSEMANKLFGFIPDSMHLRAELENLLTEQIVGFYDPKTKVLYIVDGAPANEVSTVISHELVHALQDQYMNLDSLQSIEGDDDRAAAAQAVIEGQAVFDQLAAMSGTRQFMTMIPGGWDGIRQQIRQNQDAMPAFANAPMVLQETLIFPYLSGAEFMRDFDQHFDGQEPRKQPYGDMPVSTQQIMHPEQAYFGTRKVPLEVTLPAPPGGPSKVRYTNDMGEFDTRLFLFQHLSDQAAAIRGAAGWAGDRYEIVDTPKGPALVWVTLWGTTVAAGQFHDQLLETISARYGAHPARTVSATPVEISGHPGVVYVDAPAGVPANAAWVDVAKVGVK
jgi:hypothetical protein